MLLCFLKHYFRMLYMPFYLKKYLALVYVKNQKKNSPTCTNIWLHKDQSIVIFYQHSISKLQILSMQICRLQYLVPSRRVQNQRDGVHFDFNLLVISHSKLSLLTFPPSARSCSKICIKYSKHGSSSFTIDCRCLTICSTLSMYRKSGFLF